MKRLIEDHFELVFIWLMLLAIFVFSTIMLARYPMNEEMTRWIEGGVITGAIAGALAVRKTAITGISNGDKPKEPEVKP